MFIKSCKYLVVLKPIFSDCFQKTFICSNSTTETIKKDAKYDVVIDVVPAPLLLPLNIFYIILQNFYC